MALQSFADDDGEDDDAVVVMIHVVLDDAVVDGIVMVLVVDDAVMVVVDDAVVVVVVWQLDLICHSFFEWISLLSSSLIQVLGCLMDHSCSMKATFLIKSCEWIKLYTGLGL